MFVSLQDLRLSGPLHRRVKHGSWCQAKTPGPVLECSCHQASVCTTERLLCLWIETTHYWQADVTYCYTGHWNCEKSWIWYPGRQRDMRETPQLGRVIMHCSLKYTHTNTGINKYSIGEHRGWFISTLGVEGKEREVQQPCSWVQSSPCVSLNPSVSTCSIICNGGQLRAQSL